MTALVDKPDEFRFIAGPAREYTAEQLGLPPDPPGYEPGPPMVVEAVDISDAIARDKDWNACPYESHANDCECGGAGGDR